MALKPHHFVRRLTRKIAEMPQSPDANYSQILTLINSLNDAIVSLDAEGKVLLYNAAALNVFDTNASIAGRYFDRLGHFMVDNQPFRPFKTATQQQRYSERDDVQLVSLNQQGGIMNLSLTISPVRSLSPFQRNKIEGYIFVMRDITKEKNLDEEKDEFLSVTSHELRTPVSIAEGTLSNALYLSEHGATIKTIVPALKTAYDQIIFLANLINDLSTLSRAERNITEGTEDVDLMELVNDLYEKYAPRAKAADLTLNLDVKHTLGMAHLNRLYLEEILQNLLTNAIKYTKTGTITIRAHKYPDRVAIAIHDTGIGISKSDQAKVFQKFYRSEDYRTRETSGSGLGLYIVQKLSHKIGATVTMQSRLNHGSTFTVTLPR